MAPPVVGSFEARDPGRSLTLYLGDNIYPRGLPREGAPDRREMERRLDVQIEAATGPPLLQVSGHDNLQVVKGRT
jgi:hypothetical protein